MFQTEQQAIEEKIKTFCAANGIPLAALEWKPIPFSGEWGISTSFFATAAVEARTGKKVVVPQRAQEIAEQVKEVAGQRSRHQPCRGGEGLSQPVLRHGRICPPGGGYGPGTKEPLRVRTRNRPARHGRIFPAEHAQGFPCWSPALRHPGGCACRIIEFAGYEVVRANYPGDMGLHVIKWLWAYLKYHNGEEPETDITQWMGKVYADASPAPGRESRPGSRSAGCLRPLGQT